jgi:Xaa-Pro dipeptidase
MVRDLREVKDKTEINYMRKAAEITSEGIEKAFETLGKISGLREYEVAAEIEYTMRKLGSDGVAFDSIVTSGDRTAFPHGGCTDRKIRRGDLVIIDIGARYKNYASDLTRTVIVGKSSRKQIKIFKIVKEAQQRAFQNIQGGIKACAIDITARDFIKNKGYGNYFVHNLGHGVGLDVHESPTLSPENEEILKAGNVVTVEPGVYITDFGGIRIEDTVLVHKNGAEKLTKSDYKLEIK